MLVLAFIVSSPVLKAQIQGNPPESDPVQLFLAPLDTIQLPAFSSDKFIEYRRPKIGLVLSGGGARGLSQVGVIQALEEAGIHPDLIVGTSIGSVIGGLYAAGYTIERLKRTARETNWQSLMRLSDETNREFIAIDQRLADERSIFSLRFDGLKPLMPLAVSNGQHLTTLLSELAIQGLYLSRDFDKLKIPFRAVSTDLYSGKRVVLRSGNLAEAMRASSTVPVLYAPVMRDGFALVDGGLRSNVPTELAINEGCDIIIAVNTTSPMRSKDQIRDPVDALDQVMNIVMIQENEKQLAIADYVISPELESFSTMDFALSDSLIKQGYEAARKVSGKIAYDIKSMTMSSLKATTNHGKIPAWLSRANPEELAEMLPGYSSTASTPEGILYALMSTDHFNDIAVTHTAREGVVVYAKHKPVIKSISFSGIKVLRDLDFPRALSGNDRLHYSASNVRSICENILDVYRSYGYSLAQVTNSRYNGDSGELHLSIDEGIISEIRVNGNDKTNHVVIRREFPLQEGDIFRFNKALQGLENIAGTKLFHQVNFQIERKDSLQILTLDVVERSSFSLQVGLHITNERNAQILTELKDQNIFGTGTELSALFFGGILNQTYKAHYSTNRLFYSQLQLSADAYVERREFKLYSDVSGLARNRFERDSESSYDRIVYGLSGKIAQYIQRFGLLHGGLRYEQQRIRFHNDKSDFEKHKVTILSFGFAVDNQDRWPYPNEGIVMNLNYSSALSSFGSDVSFTKLAFSYGLYISGFNDRITFHPSMSFGYGDNTLPMSEEFRLGGQHSFYGTRENEYTGRQLFLASIEARYLLPIKVFFDSYVSIRYDLGRVWDVPENIKFEELRHGLGVSLGLDTPIGPADFGIGKSFLFQDNIDFPIAFGPTYLYFSIGVGIPTP
jgi:NTE family protein